MSLAIYSWSMLVFHHWKISTNRTEFSRLPLPTYTLLRVAAIPMSVILNASLNGASHSTSAKCCLTVATLGVILVMMPLSDINALDFLHGASLSVAEALFPIVLVNAFDGRHLRRTNKDLPIDEERKCFSLSSFLLHLQGECTNFWSIIRHVSFLSTVFLVGYVFISGELQSIQQNCYVLDVGKLRWFLLAGGLLNGAVTILMALLAIAASPVTVTFLAAPMNAYQLAIFTYSGFSQYRWIGLSVCWALGLAFIFFPTKESHSNSTATTHKSYTFVRNIFVTLLLCGALYGMNGIGRASKDSLDIDDSKCTSTSGLDVKGSWPEALNQTYGVHDDYLGRRPPVHTIANLTFLMEQCIEIEHSGGIDDVVNCLSILEQGENQYFFTPKKGPNGRVSKTDAKTKDSGLIITEGSTLVNDHATSAAVQPESNSFFGACAGPVIPFHVYWTGSATWRVELFIKAYFYTQNLPCSRLWLWMDSDLDANAVEKILCKDPIFQRFLPFIDSRDIVLKSWTFPSRVPLTQDSTEDASTANSHQRAITKNGETALANGITQDAAGQQWLNFDSSRASLTPTQISDAVRFIVLHLHGGVYCDMDILLLRDLRPLLLPDPTSSKPRAFA